MSNPKRYEEFADLVRLSTSQILAYIHAMLLNWNDTEDLFQETCLVLWQRFEEFESGTNFLAWALRIADYKVKDFHKKHARHLAFTLRLRDELQTRMKERASETATENLTALSGCMKHLTTDDRKLVTLCHGESVPVCRIADMLERSPQSVHHSLRRIRNWLLACVQREQKRTDVPIRNRSPLQNEELP